jgi:hypothetical protein
MKQQNEGVYKQTFSLDKYTGRFLKDDPVPLPDAGRRFSCVFLSNSAKDAVTLHHHLSAAGIRAYHASDNREAEVLLAITSAKILLIDIDRTFEPWLGSLQRLDASHPNVPKVIITAQDENIWPQVVSHFVLDVVPKPANFGDLLGALENAHSVERELDDPERARAREMRVLAPIRSVSHSQTSKHLRPKIGRPPVSVPHSIWRSIRVRLPAMIDKVNHVWWKFGHHRTREQHSRV